MASRCDLTGKGKMRGNRVSFSQQHSKRWFKPNLQKKTLVVDGEKISMVLSTKAIRTLKKKGILTKGTGKANSSPSPLAKDQPELTA